MVVQDDSALAGATEGKGSREVQRDGFQNLQVTQYGGSRSGAVEREEI